MSWREQLRDAFFRGVPFKVDSADHTFGRRTIIRQFPFRDKPQTEDLGSLAQGFSIEAYVIGEEYFAARDALAEALATAGPGTLVHPYLGELFVEVNGEVRMVETTREGGMARFTIKFTETSEALYPDIAGDTPGSVSAACDAALASSSTAFAEGFNVGDLPAFVSEAAATQVESALAAINSAVKKIASLPDAASGLVKLIDDTSATVSDLLLLPVSLAGSINSIVSQIQTAAARPEAALQALRTMFDFGDDLPAFAQTTTALKDQATNQAAISTLVQQAASIEAARAASRIDFATHDDAVATRNELIAQLDKVAGDASSDDLYYAIADVRRSLIEDINTRAADLGRLVNLVLPESTPALELAYRLYGDATRDAEIVTKNAIVDPLFLPSGVTLQVLADG
jgi:prophage DNA circulation protein